MALVFGELVAIQHSSDSISRVYEMEGGGKGLYSTAFDPPSSARYSASKRSDNISKASNKLDRPSTLFETLFIQENEGCYHPNSIRPLCGCHPRRSLCSSGSRKPSRRISLRPTCSVHILRRYWCRVHVIRPARRPPIHYKYVSSLFDAGAWVLISRHDNRFHARIHFWVKLCLYDSYCRQRR